MATTTRALMRQTLSQYLGDEQGLSLSTSGAGSTTTVVDSLLKNFLGGADDDFFIDYYVIITKSGHTAEGQIRIVSDYVASSGTLTVQSAFTATTGSSTNYELHRIDPTAKHNALNRALEELFPDFYLPIRDETLIVDSILANGDFETTGSPVFESWSAAENSATAAVETTIVFHGTNSLKITSHGSAGVGQVPQTLVVNINEVATRTISFRMRGWSATASEAALRLSFDGGSTFTTGTFHTGNSEWKMLSVSATIPSDATSIKVYPSVIVGTNVAYFDLGSAVIDPVYQYTIPTSIINDPSAISQQRNESDVDGPYDAYGDNVTPQSGRIMRIEGMGLLSRPSTETGTTELAAPHINVVYNYAAWFIARTQSTSQAVASLQKQGRMAAMEWLSPKSLTRR